MSSHQAPAAQGTEARGEYDVSAEEAPNAAGEAVEKLHEQLGRSPRPSELARHMRIPLDEVVEAVAEHREPATHTNNRANDQPQRAYVMDERAFTERVARVLAREADIHRRAIECHETAVANLSAAGDSKRVEAARVRLANARKRLDKCLEPCRTVADERDRTAEGWPG